MFKILAATAATLATAAAVALPADASSAKTYHFYGKQTSSQLLDAAGQALHGVPTAGDVFISTDEDYLGTHVKHAKTATASDHIVCTFLVVDEASHTFSALCDAQFALPGGMLIADHVKVAFGTKTVVKITGGTGKYRHVKSGTVTSTSFSDKSDDSDFTVTF